MAMRILTVLIDDLTGEELAGDTATRVRFGLDGVNYGIDLHERRAAEFRNMISRYAQLGRRSGQRPGTPRTSQLR